MFKELAKIVIFLLRCEFGNLFFFYGFVVVLEFALMMPSQICEIENNGVGSYILVNVLVYIVREV